MPPSPLSASVETSKLRIGYRRQYPGIRGKLEVSKRLWVDPIPSVFSCHHWPKIYSNLSNYTQSKNIMACCFLKKESTITQTVNDSFKLPQVCLGDEMKANVLRKWQKKKLQGLTCCNYSRFKWRKKILIS